MMRSLRLLTRAALIGTMLVGCMMVNAKSCGDLSAVQLLESWTRSSGTKLVTPAKQAQDMGKLTSSRLPEAGVTYVLCKEWPAKPKYRLILATIPLQENEAAKSKEMFELDAMILVVNASSRIVASSPILKNYLQSDSEFLTNVEFDTGRYQLNVNTIAFGIRLGHQVGRWDSSGAKRIDLFFIKQSTLQQALKSFPVYHFSLNRGMNCGAVREEFYRTVFVKNTSSFGLADLRVVQKSDLANEQISPKDPEDCIEKITTLPNRLTTLRYNGSHYVIPNDWNQ
jgi:hypothetical protein